VPPNDKKYKPCHADGTAIIIATAQANEQHQQRRGGGFHRTTTLLPPTTTPTTNTIHPSTANEYQHRPRRSMTTTSTSTHQCHRAYPAQSNECRAQRRRGVVPPEPSSPTSSTSVERGRGSEEAALPRVVELVCWRRMEVAGIYLPPPGQIVPDRMQAKGWDPSIPIWTRQQCYHSWEVECHFQGWRNANEQNNNN